MHFTVTLTQAMNPIHTQGWIPMAIAIDQTKM